MNKQSICVNSICATALQEGVGGNQPEQWFSDGTDNQTICKNVSGNVVQLHATYCATIGKNKSNMQSGILW